MYKFKNTFDLAFAIIILLIALPFVILTIFFVWINDFKNPIYFSNRVAKNNKDFKMYKIRTMVINAENNGVSSTSENDTRITTIGKFVRKYKESLYKYTFCK